MESYCIRQGQVEVGVIKHDSHEFHALGASVIGTRITGYTHKDKFVTLKTWCGKTMLDCRCEVVERSWNGTVVLLFRLTNRRFIVGYALAESGMLFRGELLTDFDDDDAKRYAKNIADEFANIDAEDEANQWMEIQYCCPTCDHEWYEEWTTACDSECPACGLKNVSALSWDYVS